MQFARCSCTFTTVLLILRFTFALPPPHAVPVDLRRSHAFTFITARLPLVWFAVIHVLVRSGVGFHVTVGCAFVDYRLLRGYCRGCGYLPLLTCHYTPRVCGLRFGLFLLPLRLPTGFGWLRFAVARLVTVPAIRLDSGYVTACRWTRVYYCRTVALIYGLGSFTVTVVTYTVHCVTPHTHARYAFVTAGCHTRSPGYRSTFAVGFVPFTPLHVAFTARSRSSGLGCARTYRCSGGSTYTFWFMPATRLPYGWLPWFAVVCAVCSSTFTLPFFTDWYRLRLYRCGFVYARLVYGSDFTRLVRTFV